MNECLKPHADMNSMPRSANRLALFALCILLSSLGLGLHLKNVPFLPHVKFGNNDYPRSTSVSTADTAKEIWNQRTMERPIFYALDTYFKEESLVNSNIVYWQDVYSVSRNGVLLPKHPLLISVIGAPFYGLMGDFGLWLINQLILVALFVTLYRLLNQSVSPQIALACCVLAALTTAIIWIYSYSFSYDLLSTLIIISGLFYLKKFPFLAGVLFGLSMYVRMTNCLYFPFFVLAVFPFNQKNFSFFKPWIFCLIGFVCVITPYLLINHLLYGNAIKGSYTDVPVYLNGSIITNLNTIQFHWNYFLDDPSSRLWGTRESLFFSYPCLFIIFLLIPFLFIFPKRNYHNMICLGSLIQISLFLSYSFWLGAGGDRFIQAAVLLLFIPTAYVIECLLNRRKQLFISKASVN